MIPRFEHTSVRARRTQRQFLLPAMARRISIQARNGLGLSLIGSFVPKFVMRVAALARSAFYQEDITSICVFILAARALAVDTNLPEARCFSFVYLWIA